jgi:outer membrane protein OmpA-like peptidoglycan-associated protein
MAHLEVKPKSGTPWWLWLLLALIALAILLLFFKGCGNKPKEVATTDSTATMTDTINNTENVVATTEPDWSKVDLNAAKSSDPDITDKDVAVSGNDDYTIYTLGENVLFATDQNSIQSSGENKLKQVVSSLNKRFKGASIGVFGNTDSTGTAGHNKQLGAQRAEAVKQWLVKSGVEEGKVSIHSLGEKEPVASNATESGREQNRNVQIVAFPAKQ